MEALGANEMGGPYPPKGRQLSRKMLMRMQKPYEEGSILLDAPQHDTSTTDELVELARDKEEWEGTANAITLRTD
jgi:hypothetical protein